MPAGTARTRSGTSSRGGYPSMRSSTARDRLWQTDHAAPTVVPYPQPAPTLELPVTPAPEPAEPELNPVAGLIVDTGDTLSPTTPAVFSPRLQLPLHHPFTLQPLKQWWLDDAGGARPLAAIGGTIALIGLFSLYYDVALVASTVGAMCLIFGGLSAEMALRSTLPQRGRRSRSWQGLPPKERKRQMVRRCSLWLSIGTFTWCAHKANSAAIEWCSSMSSKNSTLLQRWEGPALNRVHCSTTAGPLDILLWPEWSPQGVAHFIELVSSDFYTDVAFYHAAGPMKLVEFGVASDKKLQRHWDERPVHDDATPHDVVPFVEGTLGYATTQRDSRTTQVFISGLNFDAKSGDTPGPFLAAPGEVSATSDASDTSEYDHAAVDQILPIGRLYSGDDESTRTLRALFDHWQAMRPRDKPVPAAMLSLEQHIRVDGNSYVRRELPSVDFIEKCQLVDAPKAQCGTTVALPSIFLLLSLTVSLFMLDIEGGGSRASVT